MSPLIFSCRQLRSVIAGAAILAVTFAHAQTPAAAPAPANAPAAVAIAASAVKGAVDTFPWIVGCWQAESARNGSTMNETWLAPHGGTLMGIGQSFRDGKGMSWEAMRMYDDGDSVKLWLRPGLRDELTLNLDSVGKSFAAFVAKEGDTVTKLRYERKGESELVATFRSEHGENRRGADFVFKKVDCAVMFATSGETAPATAAKP
jgi:hypothetical protein